MTIQKFGEKKLRVAIIGAGPAGLAAAIEIAKLPFVDWSLYEKSERVKEIGAGISIQRNTWRMLEVMNAAKNLAPEDFYRSPDQHYVQHRNGRTGELLTTQYQNGTPLHHLHARAHRAKLQNALLKEVDQTHIRLSSKLIDVQRNLLSGRIVLTFANGVQDEVDLLVGADGIRSVGKNDPFLASQHSLTADDLKVVRHAAFPEHRITYTGRTSYRTLVRTDEVERIKEIPDAVAFWHGPKGKWVYTCNLGGNVYEITTMAGESPEGKDAVSWGQEATIEQMTDHYQDFHPAILRLLSIPTTVQQYALFAGPRLPTVVNTDWSTALIGDASHPLSGAFGAGAGFALEDAYVLAQSLFWADTENKSLSEALRLFDNVRSPHYKSLYGVLDEFAAVEKTLQNLHLGYDDEVAFRVDRTWSHKHNWIYHYDVQQVFKDAIAPSDKSSADQSRHLDTGDVQNDNLLPSATATGSHTDAGAKVAVLQEDLNLQQNSRGRANL